MIGIHAETRRRGEKNKVFRAEGAKMSRAPQAFFSLLSVQLAHRRIEGRLRRWHYSSAFSAVSARNHFFLLRASASPRDQNGDQA